MELLNEKFFGAFLHSVIQKGMVLVRCPNLTLPLMDINDHTGGSLSPLLRWAGTDVLVDV